jgi:ribosome-associated protein
VFSYGLVPPGVIQLSAPSAHDAQPDAVPNTANEQEPVQPFRDEDASLENLILRRLDDDKAQDVVHIDLKGKSSVADSMIVASGRSHRHVGAIADHLLRALKDAGYGKAKVEGLPHCDWVLIDAGDVVVHLFRPEVRTFYNIEKIWAIDAPHRTEATTTPAAFSPA